MLENDEHISANEFFAILTALGLRYVRDNRQRRQVWIDDKSGRLFIFLVDGSMIGSMYVQDPGWTGAEKRWPITSRYAGRQLSGARTMVGTLRFVAHELSRLNKSSRPFVVLFDSIYPDADGLDFAWWLLHSQKEILPPSVRSQVSELTGYDRIETSEEAIDASKMMKGDLSALAMKTIDVVDDLISFRHGRN